MKHISESESSRDFILVDLSYLETSIMTMGHIRVDLDLQDGLYVEIYISIGEFSFTQVLDYIGILFC